MSFRGYGGPPADPFGGQPFGGGWSGPPAYQAPPPPSQETNPLATLSIVFAFLFAPAGAVLGHVALSQIKRLHQKGRDRAIIGVVLSYFMISVAVIALVVWLVLPNRDVLPIADPSTATTKSVPTSAAAPTPTSAWSPMPPIPTATATAPTAVTDTKFVDALLDAPALARLLGQEFDTTRNQGPTIGGREAMPDRFEDESTPRECIGAIWVTPPGVYRSANVAHFATQTWWTAVQGPVMSVEEAVVVLPSAAEAQALFASFSQQWKACDGRTVTENRQADNGFNYLFTPEDVRLVDSIVAATVRSDRSTGGWETFAARALGVRNNYIVEVDVSFYESTSGVAPTPLTQTAGIEVAKAMMAKAG